jgi:tRNA(Ile)-lysidine synthase
MDKNYPSLDDAFSFVREKGSIIVAVSGGSDSMAALFLSNVWAKKTGREIHAVTVDHGLRAEAAAEAAFVAMVCDRLDIVHTTLAWDGIKPTAGISAAARNARYDLIEEFARDIGVRIIVTGHTSDDQAETVLMRLRRSKPDQFSSGRGHSGMCRRTLLSGGTLLLRPFLGVTRDQLRTYLNDVSQSWIEDPSNHDEVFERIRLRNELRGDTRKKSNLLRYSAVMGRMREVVSRAAARLLADCCTLNFGQVFNLDPVKLRAAPYPVLLMSIKAVIASAGGGLYLVSDQQLQSVLDDMSCGRSKRVTLGNCVIDFDIHRLEIYREARNLNSTMIGPGESHFWDGRLQVINDSQENIRIEAMSAEYITTAKKDRSCKFKSVRKSILLSSPLITMASGLTVPVQFDRSLLPPHLELRTGALAIENFCPEWDFALLEWVKSIDLQTSHSDLINTIKGE